jgi:hypothetical protein
VTDRTAARRSFPRLRLPSTRRGAYVAAAAIAGLGFLIGIGAVLTAPGGPAQGVLRLFRSGNQPRIETRRGYLQPLPTPTPVDRRPELWRTPVARIAFPNEAAWSQLFGSSGAIRGVYDPRSNQRSLLFPPVRDSVGRPVLSAAATFGAADQWLTPGPSRPAPSEPTLLSVTVSLADAPEVSGCLLASTPEGLTSVGTIGRGSEAGCRSGIVQATDTRAVAFAVLFEALPNYQAQSGAWYPGAVFGRTEIRIALQP